MAAMLPVFLGAVPLSIWSVYYIGKLKGENNMDEKINMLTSDNMILKEKNKKLTN